MSRPLEVERSITPTDVNDVQNWQIECRVPVFIRSDNDLEPVANAVRSHLSELEVETWFIAHGARWENGYIESFSGMLWNELLSREVLIGLLEARAFGTRQYQGYDNVCRHSSPDYQTSGIAWFELRFSFVEGFPSR